MNQLTNYDEVLQENPNLLQTIPVLNEGHIRLVDWHGNDKRVVDAARISYQKGTKSLRDDAGLINYLIENNHMSPLELCNLTFHVKAPIFVIRQWDRHRTQKKSEMSARYSEMPTDYYVPEPERIQKQSKENKQGSAKVVQKPNNMRDGINVYQQSSFDFYEHLLGLGVSRELARIVLPVGIYTEMYFQMDLRNLLHFLKLRLDSHAQYEIRVYAEEIAKFVQILYPLVWNTFEEHQLNAVKLSATELALVVNALSGVGMDNKAYLETKGEHSGLKPRQVKALIRKLGL